MTGELPIGLVLVLGGLVAPLVPKAVRSIFLLALPVLAFVQLLSLSPGQSVSVEALGLTLEIVRVDRLSLAFGYIFAIAALINVIFSWHVRDSSESYVSLVYAGSALGAVFAGDLITLFVFWEATAIASVVLIWGQGSERARRAGLRYIIVQFLSGMLLLAGAAMHYQDAGSVRFDLIGLGSAGGLLILLAFGIKCAFPLLHNWLQDAYPEASATATVVLSSFTTKLGIYALARGFPGTEPLIWIGVAMTAFPIFYAVIENDLRRVLAYSINNQLGFMVVGIGLGTELALNGTVAHAFADILFKALLLMSMGAVLFRTGTVKGSELGGLYKSMPLTAGFCIVGAASISAVPLFSAFVTKSMIMASAAEQGYLWVWLALLFASAGVVEHAGIKIPFFAFFGHDSGIRCKEAPLNMLIAMAIAAALCIGIGTYPAALYAILPHPVDYAPFTASHVLAQLQLLFFAVLGVFWLMRAGIYPPELRSVNLDSDWFYRRFAPALVRLAEHGIGFMRSTAMAFVIDAVKGLSSRLLDLHRPSALLARTWSTSGMALSVMVILLAYLLAHYLL